MKDSGLEPRRQTSPAEETLRQVGFDTLTNPVSDQGPHAAGPSSPEQLSFFACTIDESCVQAEEFERRKTQQSGPLNGSTFEDIFKGDAR